MKFANGGSLIKYRVQTAIDFYKITKKTRISPPSNNNKFNQKHQIKKNMQ